MKFNFFDLNENGKYDWWEYILPIIIVLIIEVTNVYFPEPLFP